MERTIAAPEGITDREFELSRTFHAPIERVFAAWTDPVQLAAWWGPHEYSNPVCVVDARVGGEWRVIMRSPEGIDHPLKGVFVEVVPFTKLVFTMSTEEHPPEWHAMIAAFNGARTQEILATVLFSESDGATTITVSQRFATGAEREAHAQLGARQGWGQSFDSLEELLLKQ